MQKVLIITYYWPPAGGPGVQRWLKLSKYLSRIGVEVFILTVDDAVATYPFRDNSLHGDVGDDVTVIRTATSEKFGLYKRFTRKKEVPFSGFATESGSPSILQKAARFARGNFMLPDARKGWNKHAVKAGLDCIKKEGIDCIITTSPPHSTQLIGRELKRRTQVRWLADFRDPWTDIYYYDLFYPTAITRRLDKALERNVLLECDEVITVSRSFKELFLAKSDQLKDSKFHIIPNGYDPEDFQGYTRSERDRPIITYAGTMTAQYGMETIVEALNGLEREVTLQMIGRWDEAVESELSRLQGHIHVQKLSYMPKSELMEYIVDSDMLLLVIPKLQKNEGIVPGKIFEYMGTGNRIWGVGPVNSNAAEIIREAGYGDMFNHSDASGMTRFIESSLGSEFKPKNDIRARYNRAEQAKVLQGIIERK